MLRTINKKRLAQAIEAWKRCKAQYEEMGNYGYDDILWNEFFDKAAYVCGVWDSRIANLVCNADESRLNVDDLYMAILYAGYNVDEYNGPDLGGHVYE